jgi:hypothetical protein
VYIAIDCEGWVLGIKKNSLGLIQMAECFDENLMKQKPTGKISINLKPGFMIRTPIRKDIIDLMSQVFTHNFLSLITFDFTADITSMMEIGLKFNMQNIIDAQVTYPTKGEKNFIKTRVMGLKSVCASAKNCVEFEAAKDAINEKKDIDFNELYCNVIEDNDPFSHMLNDKFWEYSASDIALTAIALAGKLQKFEPCLIKKSSKAKANAFVEIQNEKGLFAPALMRQFSFIGKDFGKSKIESEKDAYKVICKGDLILDNYDSYEKLAKKRKSSIKSRCQRCNGKSS